MAYDVNITIVKGVVTGAVTAVAYIGAALLLFPQACGNTELIGAVTILGTSLVAMADNWRKHHADPPAA